jgi:hypothetical protein
MAKHCISVGVIVVVISIALGSLISYRYAQMAESDKQVHYDAINNATLRCQLLADSVIGAEDITMLTSSIALVSSDDRLRLWQISDYGPSSMLTPNGAMYALDLDGMTARRVDMRDYPFDVDFHPHGISVVRDTERSDRWLLYVVNHAYMHGGERIDVFDVTLNSHYRIDDVRSAAVDMRFVRSIVPDILQHEAMGILNDLVVVDASTDELYVTQWLSFPDPVEGRSTSSVQAITSRIGNLGAWLLNIRRARVWHCKQRPDHPQQQQQQQQQQRRYHALSTHYNAYRCHIAADNGSSFNGIASDAQHRWIIVAEPITRELAIYERMHRNTANPTLRLAARIATQFAVDNIELDAESGKFYMGSVDRLASHVAFTEAGTAAKGVPSKHSVTSGGGAQSLTIQYANDNIDGNVVGFDVQRVLMLDGSLLSAISAAVRVHDRIILGSWCDYGIAVCTLSGDMAM